MLPHMKLLGFFHTEKPKKIFFEQPNNQKPKTKKLNKSHFQGFVNSQYFFMKISWIGPWVSRIDWCKRHWRGSKRGNNKSRNEDAKKCPYCEKTFQCRANYNEHVKAKHEKDTPLNECDKSYATNGKLLTHKQFTYNW